MSIKFYANGREVPLDRRQFPGGETYISFPSNLPGNSEDINIDLAYENDSDLFALALLVDAIRREFGSDTYIRVEMPYLPYARQDRVCVNGESLSIKVVADFINSLKLDLIVCKDIHSDVGAVLLNNLEHGKAKHLVWKLLDADCGIFAAEDVVLVSPDAGANKKVLDIAKYYGFPNVVRADKTRDVLTGKITGTAVYSEHVGDKDFLIIDDICDGGRTFIELAKELRKLTDGKVYLYVTHGIFSAGLEVFDGLVDRIFVNNPMRDNAFSSPLVTVL